MDTNYSLWKVARAAGKPPSYMPPLRKPNNEWAKSDRDKAEVFANHLEQTFLPKPDTIRHQPLHENHGWSSNQTNLATKNKKHH